VGSSAERMRRLRERRRAERAAAAFEMRRDRGELLLPAVEAALGALGLADADSGAAALACGQARVIDRARDPATALRWHGPLVLAALTELGGTPMARARRARSNAR
jgi:hypothetical protein